MSTSSCAERRSAATNNTASTIKANTRMTVPVETVTLTSSVLRRPLNSENIASLSHSTAPLQRLFIYVYEFGAHNANIVLFDFFLLPLPSIGSR